MEKRLEKMRGDIKRRLNFCRVFAACLVIAIGVSAAGILPVRLPNENQADYANGFQLGALTGVLAIVLMQLVKYQRALKDEKRMRQVYYAENDERMKYIRQRVGASAFKVSTVLILIVAVGASYFNFTIAMTLVAVVFVQSLVQVGMKFYFLKNYTGEEN